jgi:hypothetical protein
MTFLSHYVTAAIVILLACAFFTQNKFSRSILSKMASNLQCNHIVHMFLTPALNFYRWKSEKSAARSKSNELSTKFLSGFYKGYRTSTWSGERCDENITLLSTFDFIMHSGDNMSTLTSASKENLGYNFVSHWPFRISSCPVFISAIILSRLPSKIPLSLQLSLYPGWHLQQTLTLVTGPATV